MSPQDNEKSSSEDKTGYLLRKIEKLTKELEQSKNENIDLEFERKSLSEDLRFTSKKESKLNAEIESLESEIARQRRSGSQNERNKFQTLLLTVFISIAGLTGSGVSLNKAMLNTDNIAENTTLAASNSEKVNELELAITKINTLTQLNDATDDSVGACVCVKKDNFEKQSLKICPTQNGVCDQTARELCEGIFGESYEC